ncbi:DHH family phosphoesterase [Clostridium vitabionis]|jgi:phosphoesterase RecJ-like protein|uniref:DHH family phosphoesterase n=1 Tax=Clostridium vitabionis TaxID=2784388 RepID=UPI00188C17D3|nr:bifunctional oligoribonuclease/PAP phosphatase NrnA [Clostridium vitabionis]
MEKTVFDPAVLEAVRAAENVVILGHVHPDGDCLGSTLGFRQYLRENMPGKPAEVCLDNPAEKFSYLPGFDEVRTAFDPGRHYDLCVTLDASDLERLGEFAPYFSSANHTFCLDHHRTNPGFAENNIINGDASSCCEVLYGCLDPEKISRETAKCIYTGLVHDTGVFRYSSTSRKTMEIAGAMMEKGIDFGEIIDGSFYRKTFTQNRLMGRALAGSRLYFGGGCIAGVLTAEDMAAEGADHNDVDGIIDQMRVTAGVECALLLYEKAPGEFKASIRSNHTLDVSRIAVSFGGGGHIRAAGFTLRGNSEDCLKEALEAVRRGLQEIREMRPAGEDAPAPADSARRPETTHD